MDMEFHSEYLVCRCTCWHLVLAGNQRSIRSKRFVREERVKQFSNVPVGLLLSNCLNLFASALRLTGIIVEVPELFIVGRFFAAVFSLLSYSSLILFLQVLAVFIYKRVVSGQECSPTHLRGMASYTSEICFAVSCLIGMGLGTNAIFGTNLKLLVGFLLVAGIVCVLVILPMHETPKFLLIVRKDRKKAIKSILFYHGNEAIVGEIDTKLDEIEKEANNEQLARSSFREIYNTPHLRKAVILACLGKCVNNTDYYSSKSSRRFTF